MSQNHQSHLQGPMFMVASMAGFAFEDALIKGLSAYLPVWQIIVLLGLGGGVFFALYARLQGIGLFAPEARNKVVAWRSVFEMFAAMLMMVSIALVPLSTVSAILQAMPLVVTLSAAMFLQEPVGWRRWMAIGIGLFGVSLIVRPWSASFAVTAWLPVGAVFALSARDLITRRVPAQTKSVQISAWGFLSLVPGAGLLFLIDGSPAAPMSPGLWAVIGVTILVGILAYGALVLSTRFGEVAVTTPFRYSRLVFALIIGVVVFHERPDAMTLLGAAIVVVAGLYTLMREMRLRFQTSL